MSRTKKNESGGFAVRLMYGVIIVQAIFSIVWIAFNICGVQDNFLSKNYISAADTLVVDDYMGILYAYIVKLLGHGTVLFVTQLLLLGAAALWTFGFSGALLVVTNPYILLCCFSVLPNSLLLACLFVMIKGFRRLDKAYLLVAELVAGIAIGFLTPSYIVIYAVLAVGFTIAMLFKNRENALMIFLAALIAVVTCTLSNKAICKVHAYERAAVSTSYLNMQRFALHNVNSFSNDLMIYQKTDLENEMENAVRIPEKLLYFGYRLETQKGFEAAWGFYDHMVKTMLTHGMTAFKPAVIDVAEYFFAPFVLPAAYLTQKQGPVIGKTLSLIIDKNYMIFKVFVWFSLISGAILSAFGIIRCIKKNRGYIVLLFFASLVTSLYASYFCLQGFDVRNVCFVMVGWQLSLPISFLRGK